MRRPQQLVPKQAAGMGVQRFRPLPRWCFELEHCEHDLWVAAGSKADELSNMPDFNRKALAINAERCLRMVNRLWRLIQQHARVLESANFAKGLVHPGSCYSLFNLKVLRRHCRDALASSIDPAGAGASEAYKAPGLQRTERGVSCAFPL